MVLSLDRWSGKVAVVTGASSGIGAGIAKRLAEEGLIVVGIARRSERIEELSKSLKDAKGKLHALKADFSQEEDIVVAFKWIGDNIGAVHILINNAGVAIEGNLVDGTTETWKKVLDLNVLGLSIATREAIQIMRKNNINGHIIHISSRAAHLIPKLPGINVYPASKHAVKALAETLRQEFNHLGLKIKITHLSPGLVTSELSTQNPNNSKERADLFAELPIIEPEDIADGVVFALSTPEHVQIHELTIAPVGEGF